MIAVAVRKVVEVMVVVVGGQGARVWRVEVIREFWERLRHGLSILAEENLLLLLATARD